jgi:DNA repair protein RecN (Recombination protein N)
VLRALSVRNFVIIEDAALELDAGFSVLTGETGAGKSMLVDAIELLVGGRADALVVREGAERAELSAEFELHGNSTINGWLSERELRGDAGRLILRRSIDPAGRARCFINGHPATLAQLREAGEFLLDIHGQHAHQSLLRPASQRALLDTHAGCEALARETARAWRDWQRLAALAEEAQRNHAAREAERAELEHGVAELKRLNPEAGEWQRITEEQARLQHGSSLLAGAQSSLEALADAEGACLPQLGAVVSRLRALAAHDKNLGSITELLESAEAQAGEALRELRHYAERIDLDPEALRAVEARIEALHAAGRRQRVRPEELPQRFAELSRRLGELELAGDAEALRREVAGARKEFEVLARKLSAERRRGAEQLSKAVTAAMQQLAMAGGAFSVSLKELQQPGPAGVEDIDFEVSAHPSLPLRPLSRVASGGELSRISLAVQLVAAGASQVGTLVFDEVDSGIGGAVAETIGKALRKLGKARQVLCVTHLPQVAACGDAQWSVNKESSRGKLRVEVVRLSREARIAELARMLGGAEKTARKHAAELLDAA